MTTWYVDYEGGTDANASAGNGDSFATRRKKIDNCVAAAIAPGDTIRVMASPTPTSIGNATWSGNYLLPTVAITSSTNATPIVVTKAAHGLATGDTVIITGHTTNTNANGTFTVTYVTADTFSLDGSVGNGVGSGGTFRKVNNCVVTLATACTANIALCGQYLGGKPNWTGSSADNVPTIQAIDYKIGKDGLQIAIAAGMTTGLSAYYATGTLDLSAYQQVSFWIKQTAGTLGAANSLSIKLCSDTAGATPVNTINVPYLGALSQWSPIVVDTGGALGSSIQSIALYVNTDNGAQTFLIDNIIACKASSAADSLNLTSLISKDPGDHSFGDTYECYWGIQSVSGTRVMLDGITNTIPGASPQRGYTGATETVTTYKRETTKTLMNPAYSGGQVGQESPGAGTTIYYLGGWNRTDMSTQTGETWYDGQNGGGYGYQGQMNYTTIDKINFARYYIGLNYSSVGYCTIGRTESAGCGITTAYMGTFTTVLAAVGQVITGWGSVGAYVKVSSHTTNNMGVGAGSVVDTVIGLNSAGVDASIGENCVINSVTAMGSSASGLAVGNNATVHNAVISGPHSYSINYGASYNSKILGGSSTGGTTAGLFLSTGVAYLRNFTVNETTEAAVANNPKYWVHICSEKHDGISGNTKMFVEAGLISQQSTIVHGTCASAWKFSPTTTSYVDQYTPVKTSIAQIAVTANALVTCAVWFRRSNTGLTGRLVCKGGQLSGVASDVVASMTAAADTWEQLTITFTPTETGVVELEAQFYGGSAYSGYVSLEDASYTQA